MPQPNPALVDAMVKEALRESAGESNFKSTRKWLNRFELAVIAIIVIVNFLLGYYAIFVKG